MPAAHFAFGGWYDLATLVEQSVAAIASPSSATMVATGSQLAPRLRDDQQLSVPVSQLAKVRYFLQVAEAARFAPVVLNIESGMVESDEFQQSAGSFPHPSLYLYALRRQIAALPADVRLLCTQRLISATKLSRGLGGGGSTRWMRHAERSHRVAGLATPDRFRITAALGHFLFLTCARGLSQEAACEFMGASGPATAWRWRKRVLGEQILSAPRPTPIAVGVAFLYAGERHND